MNASEEDTEPNTANVFVSTCWLERHTLRLSKLILASVCALILFYLLILFPIHIHIHTLKYSYSNILTYVTIMTIVAKVQKKYEIINNSTYYYKKTARSLV